MFKKLHSLNQESSFLLKINNEILRRVVWWIFTDVSVVFTVCIIRAISDEVIALMMEAVSTSEMPANLHRTARRNVTQLHSRCRKGTEEFELWLMQ
jgi:hypothetical protein